MLRLSVLGTLVLTGCSIVNSADDFVVDEGCNLDLTVVNFSPHVQERVEYRVVHQKSSDDVLEDGRSVPSIDALAVFEPLGFITGRLIMPRAVFPQRASGLRGGGVDFWADVNDIPGYQFDIQTRNEDHGWRLDDICRDQPFASANVPASPLFDAPEGGSVFNHDVDFDDLIDPLGLPLGVEVDFEGLAMLLPDGVDASNVRVEAHVNGVQLPVRSGVDGERENRAVGFWRTNSLRGLIDQTFVATGRAQLPSILIDGENYQVRVLFDVDGDDFFAAGGAARAYEFEFPATVVGLPPCSLRRNEDGLCQRLGRKFNSAGGLEEVSLVSVLVNPAAVVLPVDEAADNWLAIDR
ncbi:MAG: hypothetical protein AAF447_04605 [Myxococcota bacterium]